LDLRRIIGGSTRKDYVAMHVPKASLVSGIARRGLFAVLPA
jgi:hypothetical protein